jgi:hypothetical protein
MNNQKHVLMCGQEDVQCSTYVLTLEPDLFLLLPLAVFDFVFTLPGTTSKTLGETTGHHEEPFPAASIFKCRLTASSSSLTQLTHFRELKEPWMLLSIYVAV